MPGMFFWKRKVSGAALFAVAMTFVAFQATRAQNVQDISELNLTYSSGQSVWPAYEGWYPNPDGTFDLWFGYLNQNYKEEPHIPIGPNNNVSAPYGVDSGQPTHFLPRHNRWVFAVRVPKDFGDKEVVWTLTSHGKTHRAYATLKPGYLHDEIGMMREFFGEPPEGAANKAPVLQIEGDSRRTAKVGQPATLTVIATDDGERREASGGVRRRVVRRFLGDNVAGNARLGISSVCGDDTRPQLCGEPTQGAGGQFSVKGLRMACFVYRGAADAVTFDPPQEKTWEDKRGGSPWAVGYVLPPIPKDNKWVINTSFKDPGSYVVRCQAHDGFRITNQNVTFTITS